MQPLAFPPMTGAVPAAPRSSYDAITDAYMEKVMSAPGVVSVVQFGSVTSPGLSDLDIVVIVSDREPRPTWDQISIRPVAEKLPYGHVVAHEIFVLPERIARQVEGFFYVDQQRVLFGDRIGGGIDPSLTSILREMIAMEYAFHRLEALMAILLSAKVTMRELILFISTARHTAKLANSAGLLTNSESRELETAINNMRDLCLSAKLDQETLSGWPERILILLWNVVEFLTSRLVGPTTVDLSPVWNTGSKMAVIDVPESNPVHVWRQVVKIQSHRSVSRRVRVMPSPAGFHKHLAAYLGNDADDRWGLFKQHPKIGKIHDLHPLRSKARSLRMDLVLSHWQFVRESGYTACSGLGYFGLNMPNRAMWRSIGLAAVRDWQAMRVKKAIHGN